MMKANPLFGDKVQKDAARRRYEALVEAVTAIIDKVDPMGLIEAGAPSNEYSPEIGTIVPRIAQASSPDEIKTILCEEFEHWFGEGSVSSVPFEEPAQAIWRAVLQFRMAV